MTQQSNKSYNSLPQSVAITEQQWNDKTTPLVSISCITYNHENYICEAIESFLAQKTSFPVEILIHDDASTDETAKKIRSYEAKYSQLVFPIYQTTNQQSQKIRINNQFQYPRARGKYIALCEGDDYWTDPLKLQKQVDFLEASDEHSFCFHNFRKLNQDTSEMVLNRFYTSDFSISLNDILLMKSKSHKFTIHMNSVMFRNYQDLADSPILKTKSKGGDYLLFIYLGSKGKGFFMNQEMSVYRIHPGGIFSSALTERKSSELVEFYYSNIINYLIINRYMDYRYKKAVSAVVLFRSELIQTAQPQNRTAHFLKILRIISDYFEIKQLSFFLSLYLGITINYIKNLVTQNLQK